VPAARLAGLAHVGQVIHQIGRIPIVFETRHPSRALGYEPRDDAEPYAAKIIAEQGEPDPSDPVLAYLGGEFTRPDLDADHLT